MESAEEADESRPPRDIARKLQSSFHGFGAALAQQYLRRLTQRIQSIDLLGQPRHAFVPIVTRDMQEIVRRILDGLNYGRMRVSGAANGDAGRKIEESVAIDIPDFGPPPFRDHERIVARIGRRA